MPKNFVFQAEDGLRDGTVTGVQTCALPISVIPGLCLTQDLPCKGVSGPSEEAHRGAQPGRGVVELCQRWGSPGHSEIGRASCRERVEIPVAAVTMKKRQTRHKTTLCQTGGQ